MAFGRGGILGIKEQGSRISLLQRNWEGGLFGPLRPGQYNLAFVFAVSGAVKFDTESNPAIWLGNATTERVTIEVVAP